MRFAWVIPRIWQMFCWHGRYEPVRLNPGETPVLYAFACRRCQRVFWPPEGALA